MRHIVTIELQTNGFDCDDEEFYRIVAEHIYAGSLRLAKLRKLDRGDQIYCVLGVWLHS